MRIRPWALFGVTALALATLTACDPVCEFTTQVEVADTADVSVPGATVVEMNTNECCPINSCTRTTDASGSATFNLGTLLGTSACEVAVSKSGFAPTTASYALECQKPPASLMTLVHAILTPQ